MNKLTKESIMPKRTSLPSKGFIGVNDYLDMLAFEFGNTIDLPTSNYRGIRSGLATKVTYGKHVYWISAKRHDESGPIRVNFTNDLSKTYVDEMSKIKDKYEPPKNIVCGEFIATNVEDVAYRLEKMLGDYEAEVDPNIISLTEDGKPFALEKPLTLLEKAEKKLRAALGFDINHQALECVVEDLVDEDFSSPYPKDLIDSYFRAVQRIKRDKHIESSRNKLSKNLEKTD